jgi:hypothetical protein
MPTSSKRKRQTPAATSTRSSTTSRNAPLIYSKRPSLVAQQGWGRQTQLALPASARSSQSRAQSARSPASSILPSRNGLVLEEEDSNDSLGHIIVAIDIKSRAEVGCAYYIAKEERLLCMEDITGGGQEIVDSRRSHCCPARAPTTCNS